MSGAVDLDGTLEQAATEHARETLSRVRQAQTRSRREFRALARELPARVHETGLVRALVELAARGAENGQPQPGSAAGILLSGVLGWLGRPGGPFARRPGHGYLSAELFALEEAIEADPHWVAYAEEDLQYYLAWVKRLAEIEGLADRRPPQDASREGGGP